MLNFFRPKPPREQILRKVPKGATCAEIGVWKGDYSERILNITRPATLHLVDPWVFIPHFPKRLYGGLDAKNQADMDRIADDVAERFSSDTRVIIHRLTSAEFFTKGIKLDWVYIDGNHSRESVLADLKASWTTSRIIAGDDYLWSDVDGSLPIKLALEEFGVPFALIGNQFLIRR